LNFISFIKVLELIAARVYPVYSDKFDRLIENFILKLLPGCKETDKSLGGNQLNDKLLDLKKSHMLKCLGILHKSIIH
jgi:hypothetical protein